jgi:hypothetical protein
MNRRGVMQKRWAELIRELKREERMKDWPAGTDIKFSNARAERNC